MASGGWNGGQAIALSLTAPSPAVVTAAFEDVERLGDASTSTVHPFHPMSDTSTVTNTLRLVNVVASAELAHDVAQATLATDLEGADYAPDPSPILSYRAGEAAPMVRLFRTGTIMVLGAPSRQAAHACLTHFLAQLDGLGISVPPSPDLTIQNMVFTADLGSPVTLDAAAVGLGLDRTEYEPEQFSGLVYRPPESPVVVLLFNTGALVITGATEPADAETAVMALTTRLSDCDLWPADGETDQSRL
jgi:transcription initiation factor TFIID TATA-box-binding protein